MFPGLFLLTALLKCYMSALTSMMVEHHVLREKWKRPQGGDRVGSPTDGQFGGSVPGSSSSHVEVSLGYVNVMYE